ncbi:MULTISPECIES: restriction endonuclease subunit S [Aeromonas]|uniref:restriction endonuclease subunit S n=1 Tax=Aeromonas TaxID=642 RepID=UPI0009B8A48B|nr:restriction endonuclease subunit S [Aeromonas caviae]MBS4636465.1 restriction endonuclease subunit S [Aeromonas caviae]WQD89235.1 restriction endonuclease subunit S [Aeromonas caviae]SQH57707.1 Type I restriction enzyme EcoKI specificity protein [Aeromonas caviae]
MSNSLPQGWASCTLADIAAVNPKTVADESLIAGFVPMSHAPTSYHGELLFDEKPWGEIKKSYTNFQDGDVIFAKVTPCFENGKAAIVDDLPNGIGAGSSEFYVLRPHCSDISQKLLFALIKTHAFMQEGATNMTGAVGLRRVPKSFVETFPIVLPPAAEQKEIADRLDILLAQVEATQARLARIPDIIKQFRQSVQAAAVSGKLTEEWRKPCPYQSINKDLTAPSCWSKCYLGDILNYVTSGSRGWAKYYSTNGSPFIRSQDISADKLIIEDAAFVDLPAKAEGTRTKVEPFDLLVTITGANVTKCALVEVDLDDAYVSQHVALIRLANSSNAKFLDLVLKAPNAGRKQLTSMAYGGGKPGLNLQNIKDVTFALPSQEEQAEIVRRVEQLFAYADSIEQQAKAAKVRVDNLTQAILAKAFRGELTADWRAANPDLISGDNSAAALLARIQAERATAKPRKRASKPAISPTSSGVPQ